MEQTPRGSWFWFCYLVCPRDIAWEVENGQWYLDTFVCYLVCQWRRYLSLFCCGFWVLILLLSLARDIAWGGKSIMIFRQWYTDTFFNTYYLFIISDYIVSYYIIYHPYFFYIFFNMFIIYFFSFSLFSSLNYVDLYFHSFLFSVRTKYINL